MPWVVKKMGSQYCVCKKGESSPIKGGCHKTRAQAIRHQRALYVNVKEPMAAATTSDPAPATTTNDPAAPSAITWLQQNSPELTVVKDVEIVKTGIEYPLASGPTTFEPDDLNSIVSSQQDPGINNPRVWLGHPDDPRIHGQRHPGGPPSGEPSVGVVTNMRLADEGHTLRGDLEGVPIWLAKIMGSAYPSRSIEGNFNVHTVTGHKYQLVMSGLALLGVCWPGVSTLEDIATLYTSDGPKEVEVIEATSEEPVTVVAAAERVVTGQVTVENLRREFYDSIGDLGLPSFSWIRAMYIDPMEVVVDDDEGGLWRVPFTVSNDTVAFQEPTKIKVNYVNATNGGISAEPVREWKVVIATFDTKEDSRPAEDGIIVDLRPRPAHEVEVILARDFNTKQRKNLAKQGHAMPDGSFPISTVADLKNAIRAIGRAKNPAAAKAHIKKRARALGQSKLIPKGW